MSLTLAALDVAGCRGESAEAEARQWRALLASKRTLDADRDRLAALPASPEIERQRPETARRAAAYQRRLQRYLERHAPEAGQPPSAHEGAALHMRSDEELRAAREYIDRAGDYRRAMEICAAALALDPGYPPLEHQLAAAQAARYMTAARFAPIKPGMTAAEVQRLLGPPNAHDVREYPRRGLVAWFYPKDAGGGAAAVWFRKAGSGTGPVFQVDFDAVDPHREPPQQQVGPVSG